MVSNCDLGTNQVEGGGYVTLETWMNRYHIWEESWRLKNNIKKDLKELKVNTYTNKMHINNNSPYSTPTYNINT